MLIYLDLLFFLNLWIDYLLLITTNIVLKYNVSYKRIIISSIIGAFSTFLVFIDNNILLTILKIIICIVMQLIVNGYKGIKTLIENVIYFYIISIILAGFLYMFNLDKLSIKENYILLIIVTPIVLYIYKEQIKKIDNYYNETYIVTIIFKNKEYKFNAYLDTGNKLYDQYKRRPISLIYSTRIKYSYDDLILVPIETANYKSILKCIKVDKIIVNNKIVKNAIVGLSNEKFKIQDINMILHKDILGG